MPIVPTDKAHQSAPEGRFDIPLGRGVPVNVN